MTKWIHDKTGGEYEVLGFARISSDIPVEEGHRVVVYRHADGSLHARPQMEFVTRFSEKPTFFSWLRYLFRA